MDDGDITDYISSTFQFDTTSSPDGGRFTDFESLHFKQFLAITSFILISIVIIGTIGSFIMKKNTAKIKLQWSNKAGRFFLISFFLALSSFYITSITMMYFEMNVYDITTAERPWLMTLSKVPYQIGRFIMELFFILRLYFIFHLSAKAINKYIIMVLILLSFIACILGIIASTGSPAVLGFLGDDPGIALEYAFASTIIGTTVSLVVMYLYLSSLYTTTIESAGDTVIYQRTSNENDGKAAEGEGNRSSVSDSRDSIGDNATKDTKLSVTVKLERPQMRSIRNITKSTLLGSIGILSTLMLQIKVLSVWFSDAHIDPTLWRSIASLDGAINIWCMYLIFTWTVQQYDILCLCCHKMTHKCCVYCAKKSIIKNKEDKS